MIRSERPQAPATTVHGANGRRFGRALLALLGCGGCNSTAWTIRDDNDVFASTSDDNYTQGLRIEATGPVADSDPVTTMLASLLPDTWRDDATMQQGTLFGQQIYTPTDLTINPPDPADRPYAGWLFLGKEFARITPRGGDPAHGDVCTSVELDAGVVGPAALAEPTQKIVHTLVNEFRPEGWSHQLRNEAACVLSTDRDARDWRFDVDPEHGLQLDLVSHVGADLGTISTRAEIGESARFGFFLPRSPRRDLAFEPAKSGTAPASDWSAFLFAGTEGHAVAHDLFLDGNTFRDGPHVRKNHFVAEGFLGVALEFRRIRAGYECVFRSSEFRGQELPQRYGALTLSWTVPLSAPRPPSRPRSP